MKEGCAKALRGRLLQVPEHVVHAADIGPRVTLDDAVGSLPSPLVGDEPRALLRRERFAWLHEREA
jgi:hypothetical protein